VVQATGWSPLVIENKVFSLPDEAQLARYASHNTVALGDGAALVLLSLSDPGWQARCFQCANGRVWTYRSYLELITLLRPFARGGIGDDYTRLTLGRWLDMLATLVDLAADLGCPSPHEPLVLEREYRMYLEQVRLAGAVQKMRCQHVAHQVRARIGGAAADCGLAIMAGFTNNTGIVEGIQMRLPGFSWQLQADQWRLAIRTPEGHPSFGRSAAARQARLANAVAQADWFDFEPVSQVLGDAPREMPMDRDGIRSYNRYDPDFVYRYVKVPALMVAEATDLGTTYSERVIARTAVRD
jgi:hypothetical protein